LDSIEGFTNAITEVEQALGSTGRLLVRYSGTETILRIMVEGPKRSLIHQYAEQLAAIVRAQIGESAE
jgi:phosphoglucosamine mutase